jgi:Asp-tRNA(Asn)/Glu-tRNA(Gln) amidotransferase A subunit family amidase
LNALFEQVDVIATPGTAIVAPPIGEGVPDSEQVKSHCLTLMNEYGVVEIHDIHSFLPC